MAREYFTPIDLNNNRLLEAVITLENVPSGSAPNPEAGRIIHDAGVIKFHNGSAWISLGVAGTGITESRQIISGAGLTGGGDLSTDRTLNVVSANTDMTVNADSITINSAPRWTTPRTITLSGDVFGSLAAVDGSAAIDINNMAIGAGVIVNNDISATAAIATSKISGLDTALTGRAATSTDMVAGAGLTGGGTLAASRIFAVGAGTGITANPDDVAINRALVDTWYLSIAGGALTGFLSTHADPTTDMQVANKRYVDLVTQGFDFKNSVVAATTANIVLSGLQTIDGISVLANQRVLVKDQTAVNQNGLYTAATGAWVRTLDADASGEISEGTLIPVEAGTVNVGSHWICTAVSASPWVPGATGSTWTRFSSVNDLAAGAGLVKSGNVLDVVSANADLTIGANSITVNSAPRWTTARTITLGGDLTGSVAVSGAADVTLNAALAAGAGGKRFAINVTAGASFNVDHNLNTTDVIVQVYAIGTGAQVELDVVRSNPNRVILSGTPSIPAGLRAVVLG